MKLQTLSLLLLLATPTMRAQDVVNFKQIYVGFDGPSAPSTFVFSSAEAASASWLADALGGQLQVVLSRVHFDRQVLIVAAVGERRTTTGNVGITTVIVYQSRVEAYMRIGVNELGCQEAPEHSYPFAMAVIDRPEGALHAGGFDDQNFPDGCKPVPGAIAHNASSS